MARPIGNGLLVALGTALVWAFLSAGLGFHPGLLVVAAFGGWLIGASVRPIGAGSWRIAVVLAVATWVLASILDFAFSQILLPGAVTPLASRLTPGAYLDYLSGTFDVIAAISIALLVLVAWRSAR
jgi:hypothetical protein